MKKVKMVTIPKCDICKRNEAVYDQPYRGRSWAYQCVHCAGAPNEIGSLLILHTPPEKTNENKTVQGKVLTDLETAFYESEIEVECPLCNDIRSMEIDSDHFRCACGALVQYAPLC